MTISVKKAWAISYWMDNSRTGLLGRYWNPLERPAPQHAGAPWMLFETRAKAQIFMKEQASGEYVKKTYRPRVVRVLIEVTW